MNEEIAQIKKMKGRKIIHDKEYEIRNYERKNRVSLKVDNILMTTHANNSKPIIKNSYMPILTVNCV